MMITMELMIQKMIIQMMRVINTIQISRQLKMGVLLTGIMTVYLEKIMVMMDGLMRLIIEILILSRMN